MLERNLTVASVEKRDEGDNIVGALWNGTRILGPARP